MQKAVWRGLLMASVLIGLAGGALAQDRPRTDPVPRPLTLAALETTAQPAPTPAPASAAVPDEAQPIEDVAATSPPRDPAVGSVTGFPIPRYVSIKAAEANARRGPSRSHRIDWVFQRRNMPVMVVAEHGHWRRVIDRDGAGGWVHYTLLSGERTAIVEAERLTLHQRPDRASMVRAEAEQGVIGTLRQCRVDWCEMEVGGFRGWVEARGLWGVDPGESFD
jgi:SH3-like domain-containing protein